jgi:hypothetical protein
VKPGGKGRLSPEGGDLAVELQERFLGQVLCVGGVSHHPQAQGVYAPAMQPVDALKSSGITLLCPSDRFSFG